MTVFSMLRPLCLLVLIVAPTYALAGAIGKVTELEGSANLIRAEKELPMWEGMSIIAQDTVRTENDGIAIIALDDASEITIGNASQLTIDEFVYNPQSPQGNASSLQITKGFFHFVSGKLARDRVKIKTPVSTIGIRGTAFAGQVDESGKTIVSLVECCVDVKNAYGTVSLERIGTYSEVTSERSAPIRAALTPDWWADEAVAALGKSRLQLGLPKLSNTSDASSQTYHQDTSSEHADESGSNIETGPLNRTSFPFFLDSLMK